MVVPVDVTEKQEDVTTSPAKQPTSKDTVVTYTQTQLDEQVRKTRSDALAEVGRFKTEALRATQASQAAMARIDKMVKDQEDAEMENARDNPDALTTLRERQARRRAEAERDQARLELDEHKERLTKIDAEKAEVVKNQTAINIASRFGVDPTRLTKLAKYTDGSPEAIEDIAKDLPVKDGKAPLRVDSGGHIGGMVSFEEIRDAYIKDPRNPAIKERYLQIRKERRG